MEVSRIYNIEKNSLAAFVLRWELRKSGMVRQSTSSDNNVKSDNKVYLSLIKQLIYKDSLILSNVEQRGHGLSQNLTQYTR